MRRACAVVGLALCACNTPPVTAIQSTVNVNLIGPAGGLVPGQGNLTGAVINIPPGALAQPTPISIGDDPQPPPDPEGWTPAGPSVLCSPEGIAFERPVVILVPYSGTSDVNMWTAPALPDAGWVFVDGGLADVVEHVVAANVDHFSRFRAYRAASPVFPDAGCPAGAQGLCD